MRTADRIARLERAMQESRERQPLTLEEQARRINWILSQPEHPNHARVVALIEAARARRRKALAL